jgi:hypothetical protein
MLTRRQSALPCINKTNEMPHINSDTFPKKSNTTGRRRRRSVGTSSLHVQMDPTTTTPRQINSFLRTLSPTTVLISLLILLSLLFGSGSSSTLYYIIRLSPSNFIFQSTLTHTHTHTPLLLLLLRAFSPFIILPLSSSSSSSSDEYPHLLYKCLILSISS